MVDNPKTKSDTNKKLQVIEKILQSETLRRQRGTQNHFLGKEPPQFFSE